MLVAREDDIERKYSRLSRDLQTSEKYASRAVGLRLASLGAVASLMVIITFLDINPEEAFNYIIISIVGVAIGVTAVLSVVYEKRGDRFRVKAKDRALITLYDAVKGITEVVDADLREEDRQNVKRLLDTASKRIYSWTGFGAPSVITSPINDIANAIHERIIPIIETGSRQDIESLRVLLYNFLTHLDVGITWESLIEFATRFKSLPSVAKAEPEKPKVALMQRPKFRYPVLVIPSWLGVFILLFYTSGQQLGTSLGVSLIVAFAILNFIKLK